MSILSLDRLGQSYGAADVFSGLTASIAAGAKIGLVGPNGAGKTSLLDILAGRAAPSAGRLQLARDVRVGYLPQESGEAFEDPDRGLREEMLEVFADLRAAAGELARLEARIAEGGAGEDSLADYGRRQEAFEAAGGYDHPQRVRQVLQGLGFRPEQDDQPVGQLSGGQKTRALLARLLLARPQLLLLDEPTNHLDMAAVAWLEGLLAGWDGAVLVVSHDRWFLDRVVTEVWELADGGLETYRGNYSAYHAQRAERHALRLRRYQDMRAGFDKELEFIRRNIAGQNTNIAKGKLARLAREVEAVHAGGLAVLEAMRGKGWAQATADLQLQGSPSKVSDVARRIGELREPGGGLAPIHLRLDPPPRGPDLVLRAQGLAVGYDGRALLQVADLQLERGERAALIGGNGTGKTTFLRTLLGGLPPVAGHLKPGPNLTVGYFAQTQEALRPGRTVLETVLDAFPALQTAEARGYLGSFLFSGDDQLKQVGVLSGGEKGRLALALLARQGANLLLLDEPTNHLDIPAQEVLEAVLMAYAGTVILVSHDRYLVSRVATQVWAVEEGRLEVHPYGYAEYLQVTQAGVAPRPAARPAPAGANGHAPGPAPAPVAAPAGAPLSKNELRRRAEAVAAIEEAIATLEEERDAVAEALQRASERGEVAAIQRLGEDHERLESEIAAAYARWEALAG